MVGKAEYLALITGLQKVKEFETRLQNMVLEQCTRTRQVPNFANSPHEEIPSYPEHSQSFSSMSGSKYN